MAMTSVVKDELSRVPVIKPCCRKAEVSTLLRFAGGLHIVEGRVVVEAELDTGAVARRLRASITEVFGHPAEFVVLAPNGLRKGNRYLVRVSKGQSGENLARQAGLIDSFGRPVRGLPRQVVAGSSCDCEAAWRGAFLAHGSLTEPGRSMALEITCPGSEAALALVGAARRLKVHAKARDVRGVDRVVIRDGEVIAAMLTRLGAHEAVLAWEERRMRREVRATANRLANFDDANLRRSARAAVAAGARVERALEILGPDAPDHLTMAGHLRMAHRQASLEELGALADPPLTKDAIAGRIRRLLAMADRRAMDQGIPSTEACLTLDMLPLWRAELARELRSRPLACGAPSTRCLPSSLLRRSSVQATRAPLQLARATRFPRNITARRKETCRRSAGLFPWSGYVPSKCGQGRVMTITARALNRAMLGRPLVKAKLMRITLHAVHADDYIAFREAMDPRVYSYHHWWVKRIPGEDVRILPGHDR
jgi:DNA-binding protein WhiA